MKRLSEHRLCIHTMYWLIQAQAYDDEEAEYLRLESMPVGDDDLEQVREQKAACYERRKRAAVMLGGMALEALLHNYAAEQLGDAFIRGYMVLLDPKAKFLISPRLVWGKQPEEAGNAYASTVRLVRLRNNLVHFKSKSFPVHEMRRTATFLEVLIERLRVGIDDSRECVMLGMDELDRLHECTPKFRTSTDWTAVA